MANEKEDTIIRDECVDILSDVPSEFQDCEELEDITSSEKENEAISSDESEICRQRIRRTLLLPNDTEESDEDNNRQWSDFYLPRNNNAFKGSSGPNGTTCLNLLVPKRTGTTIKIPPGESPIKKSAKFFNVTAVELKKWFGLIILMEIVKKPRIEDYWSTNPLLETPIFGKTMFHNRFRQILSFLYFSDNSKIPANADRLFKVQGIIYYFTKKFQENFNLGQNITIDEGIIPWRGRLSFKVYKPSKIKKYGILIRMLCDSVTGYISRYKIYSGIKKPLKDIVIKLLKNVTGKWHHLYMDNCYNNVELAEDLLTKKIRVYSKKLHFHDFLLKICESWIKDHSSVGKENLEVPSTWRASSRESINRFTGLVNTS
ncbi:uncharacterized protein LOC124431580 [Vespa crabro]|uniref:uncharacterized protein LOC124431580 n=1 Tax=Vespa crabro TaxID=7445 RepID=UPI001F004F54|nr:uncharacterized protein LOC124431580 [Vespa crabro]